MVIPNQPISGGGAPGPAPKRSRGRWFLIGGAVAMALVLLGGSFLGGWILGGQSAGSGRSESTTVQVPVLDPLGREQVMPDVRGLTEARAMQALADAGIVPATVTKSARPAAGPSGVVIEQTPVFGTDVPDRVALVLSSRAVVPAAVGTKSESALAELAQLGAGVVVQGKYDPKAAEGVVLAIEPAAGAELTASVTVTVNVAPSAAFLGTIKAERSRCDAQKDLIVGGQPSANTLSCPSAKGGSTSTWLLAGAVDRFTATAGILDSEDVGSTATMQLLVDGKAVKTLDLVWGKTAAVDIPLSGALRLDVVVTSTGVDRKAALVDPLLLGDAVAMTKLRSK